MDQVDLTTLCDSILRMHVTIYTTERGEALQTIADADSALAKIDAEFVRRNSHRAVGVVVDKFFAQ